MSVREAHCAGRRNGPREGNAYLAVVKRSLHRHIVHVFVQDGCHLSFLDGADATFWMKDEDADVGFGAQACDGSAAGITAGCADDGESLSVIGGGWLSLVPTLQKVLEEIAKELEGDVLEGKGGAMPQFKAPFVLCQTFEGDDLLCAEGGIRAFDEGLEVLRRDSASGGVGGDEEGEDFEGEGSEREGRPACLPIFWESRDGFGDVEAAVGSETGEYGLLEGETLLSAACAEVLHGGLGKGGGGCSLISLPGVRV